MIISLDVSKERKNDDDHNNNHYLQLASLKKLNINRGV
jgi:hypothetical protein